MANSGVFTIDDINFLKDNQQYPSFGQLELIQTQVASGSSLYIDFTNIKENTYNVHFLTWNNAVPTTDQKTLTLRLSDDGGSTYESSNYDFAFQNFNSNGSFNNNSSTTGTFMYCSTSVGNASGESANGYAYLYNLGDSAKYSFHTWQNTDMQAAPRFQVFYGSSCYHVASTINALRLGTADGSSNWSGDFSLYGIRFT